MHNWKLISKDYRKLIIFIYTGNILGFIYLLLRSSVTFSLPAMIFASS